VRIEVPLTQRDIVSELLWRLDTLGFSESEKGETLILEAFFSGAQSGRDVVNRVSGELTVAGAEPFVCCASLYDFEPKTWLENYRSSFQEFSIGENFFIYPPWSHPSTEYRANIMIEPALAFGTGTHESTRLALLAIEPLLPRVRSMLDVGTGSGILSIGAKKLNPNLAVTAFDNDWLAVKSAWQNLEKNQLDDVYLFAGEVAALSGSYDLIVANLTLEIFKQLAADLCRIGTRHLVLSGFTTEQMESVLYLFKERSTLKIGKVWEENEWMALHLRNATVVN
jgi:ribosomal protein L11 methyltransferase